MKDHPWRFDNQMPPGRAFEIYHEKQTAPLPAIYHGHEYYELYFILQGSIRVIAGETDVEPVLGDVLLYPPGCMHRVTHTDPDRPYERFYVYLSKGFLAAAGMENCCFIHRLDALAAGGNCIHPGKQAVMQLLPLADEIIEGARDETDEGTLANRCRMVLFLVKMLKLLEKAVVSPAEIPSSRMNELIAYINQNAARPLPLDHLEAVFGISKYALLHEFKAYTGMPIHQYILTRRIHLAQQLMQQGVKPRQACQQCGFADYTSFYRAFKTRTGQSPAQYSKK